MPLSEEACWILVSAEAQKQWVGKQSGAHPQWEQGKSEQKLEMPISPPVDSSGYPASLELGKGVFTFLSQTQSWHSDSPNCLANICETKLYGSIKSWKPKEETWSFLLADSFSFWNVGW